MQNNNGTSTQTNKHQKTKQQQQSELSKGQNKEGHTLTPHVPFSAGFSSLRL